MNKLLVAHALSKDTEGQLLQEYITYHTYLPTYLPTW